MKKTRFPAGLLSGLLFLTLCPNILSARPAKKALNPRLITPSSVTFRNLDSGSAGNPLYSIAPVDTYVLAEFSFDRGGFCDVLGWTSHDRTAQEGLFWHVDNYRAIQGSHSLWCGHKIDSAPPWCTYATLPGYGNFWDQIFGAVTMWPSGDVTITFEAIYDSEPGFDFTYLEIIDTSFSWTSVASYSGTGTVSANLTIPAGQIPGDLHLRFHFVSDGGWSDQDGLYPSGGAFILDNLLVTDTLGILCFEDFEAESLNAVQTVDGIWSASAAPGFGDFAGLFPGNATLQEDGCTFDPTCLWGFFKNSGEFYDCATPTPHPEQEVVPYGNARGQYIWNEIWSPQIDWHHDKDGTPIPATASDATLEFKVYADLHLFNLVFGTWSIRPTFGSCPDNWLSPPILYSNIKQWINVKQPVGAYVNPLADSVQISLGVIDLCKAYCGLYAPICHSHAPLFDDVRIYRTESHGPEWIVRAGDLFQDNFPADGTTTGTVRCDMARDRMPASSPGIYPGDSVVVMVSAGSVGIGTSGPPDARADVYCYVRSSGGEPGISMVADSYRWPLVGGPNASGYYQFQCDSSYNSYGAPLNDEFCFDLNDNLFTPGDTIEFYFSATDLNGVTTYWSEFTGPTLDRADVESRPSEMTCLPTGNSEILFVDNADGLGAQPYFEAAFQLLGINPDRYDVRDPESRLANHPGARAQPPQVIDVYKAIIWSSSYISGGCIGDGTTSSEKSDDAGLLFAFLDQSSSWDPGLYLTGDDIAFELTKLSGPGVGPLLGYMNYTVLSDDHKFMSYSVSPSLVGEPPGIFYHGYCVDRFFAYGGCPALRDFDVLSSTGNSALQMTYENSGGPGDGAVISQITTNSSGRAARVVLSGFSFEQIREDVPLGVPDREHHMYDILNWFQVAMSPSFVPASSSVPPSNRDAHALAEGPWGVSLFGGNANPCQNDTWLWSSSQWTQESPDSSPPLRHRHGMVYDSARNRIVLFGGRGGPGGCLAGVFDDTWELYYSLGTPVWVRINSPTNPPARFDHGIAYDSSRNRVVIFGGSQGSSGPFLDDTWEYDGSTWIQATPAAGPSARGGNQIVFDAARGEIVLFGGMDPSGAALSDTWIWDGTNWMQVFPAHNPPPRYGHGMAYHAINNRVVLFGGTDGFGGFYNDTWEWDGTDWIEKIPNGQPNQPIARYFLGGNGLAYDATGNRVILFGGNPGGYLGGYPFLNDTWVYDGFKWTWLSGWANIFCQEGPPTGSGDKIVYTTKLFQNYPNPFNPVTTIRFSIKERSGVQIRIYDILGRLVRTLIDEYRDPGIYTDVQWDGRNETGESVASGIYFARLVAGGHTEVKKMLLLK